MFKKFIYAKIYPLNNNDIFFGSSEETKNNYDEYNNSERIINGNYIKDNNIIIKFSKLKIFVPKIKSTQ